MIQLTGERQFAVPIVRLFAELSDLQKVVQSLPEVKTVKSVTSEKAELTVSPGLSFVKGELDTVVEKVSESPPTSANLTIASKGIGSSSKVQASFILEPTDTGTRLKWTADVIELGGLLKLVPKGVLQGAGRKVIVTWLANLEKRLTS